MLVSTHYMDEAERCHRLAILAEGRLVAEGPPRQLMRDIAAAVVEIEAEDVAGARRPGRRPADPQHRAARHAPARAARPRHGRRARPRPGARRGGRRHRRGPLRAGEPRGRVRRLDRLPRRRRAPAGGALRPAVLARIGAVMVKELRQLARDRLTFGMIVGIPLMQMLLFGYAINYDVRESPRRRRGRSRHQPVARVLAALEASGVVEFAAPSAGVPDLQRRMPARRDQRRDLRPAGLRATGDRALATGRPVAGRRQRVQVYSLPRGLAALPVPRRDGRDGATRRFELRTYYNPEARTAVHVVPALIGVILTITMVIFTAVAIVRERERGNLELLITTPVRSGELMTGSWCRATAAIGLVQVTLVLMVGSPPLRGAGPRQGGRSLSRGAGVHRGHPHARARDLDGGPDAVPVGPAGRLHHSAVDAAVGLRVPVRRDGPRWSSRRRAAAAHALHTIVRGIVLRGASITDLGRPAAKLAAFLVVTLAIATLRFRKRLD